MKRILLASTSASVLLASSSASAGGLFLPGSGAVSTSRAGAAVASADDGEALSINPAGLARTRGTTITVSMALIQYAMQFTRSGTYDAVAEHDYPYEGQPFGTVENQPKPPLGIGTFQPIPVVAVVSDLGGRVEGLRVAAGLYAPSGYPFRDMTQGYEFNAAPDSTPPPPTRYDVMKAESMLLFPSIAAAYQLTPKLDVGARFSFGRAKAKNSVVVHGTPGNTDENVKEDALFEADVADGFVPTVGLGLTYKVSPTFELGAAWSSPATLRLKGTAKTTRGPDTDQSRVVGPLDAGAEEATCAPGVQGTAEAQNACITLQLPMNMSFGARIKVLGADDETVRGDLELNVAWENWGKRCNFSTAGLARDPDCASPGQFLVQIDSGLFNTAGQFAQALNHSVVNLGLQNTWSVRLGGSYHIPVGDSLNTHDVDRSKIILRGGVAYDTAAARDGWLRASFDGAARVTTALGAGFRTQRLEINFGAGAVWEGEQTNPGTCDPNPSSIGCRGDGSFTPIDERGGPDPSSPLLPPENQFESPFNQGTIKSRYLLIMLGVSTWF